jgi:hypothetical protein
MIYFAGRMPVTTVLPDAFVIYVTTTCSPTFKVSASIPSGRRTFCVEGNRIGFCVDRFDRAIHILGKSTWGRQHSGGYGYGDEQFFSHDSLPY